jgi:hypothetical protein
MCLLLLAAPARALIIDSGDGQGNTTAPADDPGFDHVGRVNSPSGVYLGNGWVLTAAHVIIGETEFGGVGYLPVPGSAVQLVNPNQSLADLQVFQIDPSPSLPLLPIRSTTPNQNANVTMIAVGLSRGDPTSWMGYDGYYWGATDGKRWGTNRVSGTAYIGTHSFFTSFTEGGTTHEAHGASGDSGGGVFVKNGGVWELAGLLLAVGPGTLPGGQPGNAALYGNYTYAADLAQYRSQIIAITRPECADEIDNDGDFDVDYPDDGDCLSELGLTELPDQDADGVGDVEDNCLVLANPDQRDTNLDGYGNLCDADYDGGGIVGLTDFGILSMAFGKSLGEPGYDADVDANGDDVIGLPDFGVLAGQFGGPPGPSGLACAGVPPCPIP